MHTIARHVGFMPLNTQPVFYKRQLIPTATCIAKPETSQLYRNIAQTNSTKCRSSRDEKATTLNVHLSQTPHTKLIALTPEDCIAVLRLLNIPATVHSTLSSVSDIASGDLLSEQGVSLILQNIQKSKVRNELWPLIRERYGLTCAHVSEHDFHGCILDWMRPSICPANS